MNYQRSHCTSCWFQTATCIPNSKKEHHSWKHYIPWDHAHPSPHPHTKSAGCLRRMVPIKSITVIMSIILYSDCSHLLAPIYWWIHHKYLTLLNKVSRSADFLTILQKCFIVLTNRTIHFVSPTLLLLQNAASNVNSGSVLCVVLDYLLTFANFFLPLLSTAVALLIYSQHGCNVR